VAASGWRGLRLSGAGGPVAQAQWVSSASPWQSAILEEQHVWWRELHARGSAGELEAWAASPWESLALVLLLDQVHRCPPPRTIRRRTCRQL
jgi:uncharacterized protein (DUF924 family)